MAETSTGRPAAGSPARIQPLRGDVDGLLCYIVADSAGASRCHPPPPTRSNIGSSWTVSTFSDSSQVLEVPMGREEGSAALLLEGMRWASTLKGATGTSPPGGSGSNIGGSGLPSEKMGGVQTSLPARGGSTMTLLRQHDMVLELVEAESAAAQVGDSLKLIFDPDCTR